MKDMAKHPWLWLRPDGTNNWYLRAKVPKELVATLGKAEIKISLRTSDRREANKLIDGEAAKVREIFAAAHNRLNARPLSDISDNEIQQLAAAWFHRTERDEAKRRHVPPPEESEEDYVSPEEVASVLEQDLDDLADRYDENTSASVQSAVDQILETAGVSLDKEASQYWTLCEFVLRGMKERVQRTQARATGDYSATFDREFSKITAEGPPPERNKGGITLDALAEKYLAATQRNHSQEKTKTDYAMVFRLTKEVFGGDKLVGSIKREDARNVKDILSNLPPNATKRFRNMTLSEAAHHAKATGIAPMAAVTANGHLNKLSTLFGWAEEEGHVVKNQFKFRVGSRRASRMDARNPFSTEQLQMIFRAPLYVGCQDDERRYAQPGPNHPRRHRSWVPLLCLFHGMRLNEACQLLVADIEARDGIDGISIAPGEGKKLKSEAATRFIPVHPELVKIGFLECVAEKREQNETRLFPTLKMDGRGYYSDGFQKWFHRFLMSAGAQASKTTFHSFRHNWRDELRAANVPLERARAMGGWAEGRGTDTNYGSGFRAPDLAKEIKKIGYEGLDLSHLHIKS